MSERKDQQAPASNGRRIFLRVSCGTVAGGASLALGAAGAQTPASPVTAAKPADPAPLPVVDVAPLEAIKEGGLVQFGYPDARSPAVLLRLAESAVRGVGPNSAIVAYSSLCTHKGCPVTWRPERKLLICPCHWSSFDPAKSGQMVIGQGSHSLPQIQLRVQNGIVQATGIDGLVYGRHTNLL